MAEKANMFASRKSRHWEKDCESDHILHIPSQNLPALQENGSEDSMFSNNPDNNHPKTLSVSAVTESNNYSAEDSNSEHFVNIIKDESMFYENYVHDDFGKKSAEDKEILMTYICDASARFTEKTALRLKNQAGSFVRPDEKHLRSLDSSLKKNAAFVRKMKTFSASQVDTLVKDLSTLNLSRYTSEIATTLLESKLKMVDIPAVVSICCLLHKTYSDFSGFLMENWQKALSLQKDEPISNPSKLRVDLCLYADLVSSGIFSCSEGLSLLGSVLTSLIHRDKEEHKNINILLSFCKHHGEDYAGLVPRKIRQLSEAFAIPIPRSAMLTPEKTKKFHQLLKDYYNSLCKHLIKEHNELQSFVRQNKKILQTRGELSKKRKEKLYSLQSSYDKLLASTISFADILDEDVPEILISDPLKQDNELYAKVGGESEELSVEISLWDSEESKKFYESIIDLKSICPDVVLKDVTSTAEYKASKCEPETKSDNNDRPINLDEASNNFSLGRSVEEEPENGNGKVAMTSFFASLLNCTSVEKIDSAAVEFGLNLNSKLNRKKLVKELLAVPRTRYDLIPNYARMVAILNPCMPDIASELNYMLLQDFRYHAMKKDQINLESKLKVIRFIGELVNFNLFPKSDALGCLKVLLQDFTHHFIEIACNLLETCGRMLYTSMESQHNTKIYLDQMMRKKSVMTMESRYVTMIEHVYYHILPTEAKNAQKKKEKPTKLMYIDKLLYKDLTILTTEKVLHQMRKLNWNNPEVFSYAIKCLTQIRKFKYLIIPCVANLVSGLVRYVEGIGIQVVDAVLEDIRICIEVCHPKFNQRCVASVMYLGELYNYRIVESDDIFKVLYSLITFGVARDHINSSPLDPPDSLLRIRLVCVLLKTCGAYFSCSSSRKKLDCFFVYFQNYYWLKYSHPNWTFSNPFPFDVACIFKDVLTSLQPKIKLYESYEEALCDLRRLETNLRLAISEIAPDLFNQDHSLEALLSLPDERQGRISEKVIKSFTLTPSGATINNPDEHLNKVAEIEGNYVIEDILEIPDMNILGTPVSNSQESLPEITSASLNSQEEQSNENISAIDEDCTVSPQPKLMKCVEDDDFMAEFDKMLTENIQDHLREVIKPPQIDIPVPLNIKGNLKKNYEQLFEAEDDKSKVTFALIVRKGNKCIYKNLDMPLDSHLAMNLKNSEEAERREKELIKRLTLDINERLEEED